MSRRIQIFFQSLGIDERRGPILSKHIQNRIRNLYELFQTHLLLNKAPGEQGFQIRRIQRFPGKGMEWGLGQLIKLGLYVIKILGQIR
jgi:hypothetical protein